MSRGSICAKIKGGCNKVKENGVGLSRGQSLYSIEGLAVGKGFWSVGTGETDKGKGLLAGTTLLSAPSTISRGRSLIKDEKFRADLRGRTNPLYGGVGDMTLGGYIEEHSVNLLGRPDFSEKENQ